MSFKSQTQKVTYSDSMATWKRQNYRHWNCTNSCQGLGVREGLSTKGHVYIVGGDGTVLP